MVLLPYVAGGPGAVSGGVLELGMVAGLVLAGGVKWSLGRAWPAMFGQPQLRKGRHRSQG